MLSKAAVLVLIICGSCALQADDEKVARVIITPKGAKSTIETNKEIVKQYYLALSKKDLSELEELLHTQFQMSMIGDDLPSTFPEASSNISQRMNHLFKAFPDLTINVESLIAESNKVVSRVRMGGTQYGPFLGIQPTRRYVTMEKIEIFTIQNDKIVHIAEMWNNLEVMKKLGYIVL